MHHKTIITYGTFDMFHIGHLRLIQRIAKMGHNIIIGVSTDEFNELKGKKCVIPFIQRAEIVRNIVGVNLVIPENSWDQKQFDIKKYNVDTLVMGSDWTGKFDNISEYCEVIYLPRTTDISTTKIKKLLSQVDPSLKENLNNLIDLLDNIKEKLE